MRRLQAAIFKYITTMTTYSLTFPRKLHGAVTLPASKSLSARALIAGALAGESRLSGLSDCDDTRVLRRALKEADEVVDIMAAGTAMRFATAYFAATEGPCRILTGTERMKRRPIGILVEALRRLGASISYLQAEGYPPLRIEGRRLHGGEVNLPASVSSQYISAMLLVAPAMTCGLTLHLEGTVMSRPYIDMTLGVMHHFGAKAGWRDGNTLHVEPGTYAPGVSFAVEPDWSAASYWYEMVALSPDPRPKSYCTASQKRVCKATAWCATCSCAWESARNLWPAAHACSNNQWPTPPRSTRTSPIAPTWPRRS